MLLKLFVKDVKVLLSDKKSLMIFILMPIILTTILSFALSGSFGEPGKMDAIKVGIVKQYDREEELSNFMETAHQMMGTLPEGDLTASLDFESIFFESFLGDDYLKRIMTATNMSEAVAYEALENGSIAALVILPEGFIFNQYVNFLLPNRNNIEIEIVGHPDYNYSTQIVSSIFNSYFDTMNKRVVNKNVFLEVGSNYLPPNVLFSQIEAVMNEEIQGAYGTQVKLNQVPGKKHISSFTYYSIAMMAMFILYSAGHTGRELLNEKKMLTLDRGVVSGVHYGKVLAAKFFMTVSLCFFQMSALILYSTFLLRVDWNNPIKVIVGIFFSSLAVSGLGVFISSITLTAENYKIANMFENVLVHVFALIGGSYIPIEVLPKIFMTLKNFALNGVVLDLFIQTYQDATWNRLGLYYGILCLIATVFTLLAVIIIKRKEVSAYEGTVKA
ncbi:MAG TPA: hypothetical protein DCS67_00700 [Clostridiales bacterium UBA8960]|nr:hypothetical protein [Clostridiales bacterium UBA8960]